MGGRTHLFGPVPSRRLGRSLGVDLTPYKTCSLDCVFCQLGRTRCKTLERREYVPTAAVTEGLAAWLDAGGRADHITLSGSGEPTLHVRFGDILAFIKAEAGIPAVLLTNGTMLDRPEVRAAAAQADIVKISLSAWDDASYGRVNRPHPQLCFDRLVESQKAFRREFDGQLWLEVFLVDGLNAADSEVQRIAGLAAAVAPDKIHLNTAVRPPAEDFAAPVPPARLDALRHHFEPCAEVAAEFRPDSDAAMGMNEEAVLALLQRRPCSAGQISAVCGMHPNETAKYLGRLVRAGRVRPLHKSGQVYYTADPQEVPPGKPRNA